MLERRVAQECVTVSTRGSGGAQPTKKTFTAEARRRGEETQFESAEEAEGAEKDGELRFGSGPNISHDRGDAEKAKD